MRLFVDASEEPWPPQHETLLQRIRLLSRVLDTRWQIPGTRYRFGLDSLVGLVPGVGDTVGALLATYMLYAALRLGVPQVILLRMMANIGIDMVVGAIPIVGDLFDVAWKANTKNAALLQAALAARRANGGTAEQTPETGGVRPTGVAGRRC